MVSIERNLADNGGSFKEFGSRLQPTTTSERIELINTMYSDFIGSSEIAKREVGAFETEIDEVYTDPFENKVVKYAFRLATVAHQYNRKIEKRSRKSDGLPYIVHPIAMARLLMGENLDYITTAATLLHDVPEDVDLEEGLGTKQEWLQLIKNFFNDIEPNRRVGLSQDYQLGILISDIVDGATEKEILDEETANRIRNTSLYRNITNFIMKGGIRHPRDEVRAIDEKIEKQICAVVYNMRLLFDRALVSPDHWRIFFIKIADVWHNFDTPKFVKEYKMLRGRIAARLADWLGLPVISSELVARNSSIIDMNAPYKPYLEEGKQPTEEDLRGIDYVQDEIYSGMEKYFAELVGREGGFKHAVVWPIRSVSGPASGHNGKGIPLPQIRLWMDKSEIQKLREKYHPKNNSPYTNTRWRHRMTNLSSLQDTIHSEFTYFRGANEDIDAGFSQYILGRDRSLLSVSLRPPESFLVSFFTVRVDSDEPTIANLFQQGSTTRPEQIPESLLLNNRLKTADDSYWNYHLETLVAFFYEQNLPTNLGQDTRILIEDGDVLFVQGNQTLRDLYRELHLPQPKVEIELTSIHNFPHKVKTTTSLNRQRTIRSWGRRFFIRAYFLP